MYKAEDGKMFDNEPDCLEYEGKVSKYTEEIWTSMWTIKKICDGRACSNCPFYNFDSEVQTACFLKQRNPCSWEKNMINKEKL